MKIVRLDDIIGTKREVKGPGWTSRRLLIRKDGAGFSMHETIIPAGAEMELWYKNHLEAVYCVAGNGTVQEITTGQVHEIRDGVLYFLDEHDRHILRGGSEDMRLVCVFNPPVSGAETHDADGSYELAQRNVFVIGLDDYNRTKAEATSFSVDTKIHNLLDYKKLITPESYDIQALIKEGLETLANFDGPIDAIVAHWDWPVSTIIPILNRESGLRYVPLVSILKCEHKYWSRIEQSKVVPELVPRFEAVNPFAKDAVESLEMPYPFWLKPIKSFASHLGFRIENPEQFAAALEEVRAHIHRIGDEFNVIMNMVDLPPEIREVDGNWCIAEQLVKGWQSGVEGYVLNGQTHVHGIFDCYKDKKHQSFNRYEYPSRWPLRVRERMIEATKKLMPHLGYNQAPFGVEFFWDEPADKLWLIEVNTRISQSHSDQFEKVHGVSNHEIAISVALGMKPKIPETGGAFRCAAKFHLRRYADCEVVRVPSKENLEMIAREMPGTEVHLSVKPGTRLSELHDQDAFSYEVATVRIGARDQAQLLARFRKVAEMLDFEFSDGGKPEDVQFTDVTSWD